MRRRSESPSSIKCYMTCPKKYQFKYLHKLPDPAGPEAEFGTRFHEAAYASWFSRDSKHEDPKISKMLAAMYDHPDVQRLPHCPLVQHKSLSAMDTVTDILKPQNATGICEYNLDVQCGDQRIFGYVDLILPTGIAIDFKTSKKAYDREKIDSLLQHFAYTYGLRRLRVSEVKNFLYIVVTTSGNPRVQVINLTISDAVLQKFEERFNKEVFKISLDLFPTQTGSQCNYCPYRNVCPAFNPNSPY